MQTTARPGNRVAISLLPTAFPHAVTLCRNGAMTKTADNPLTQTGADREAISAGKRRSWW
jgi:hypothetical protein